MRKNTQLMLGGILGLFILSSMRSGAQTSAVLTEKRRQTDALMLYNRMMAEGLLAEDEEPDPQTMTRAVEEAKALYRSRGGSDVAFIARLDALGPPK